MADEDKNTELIEKLKNLPRIKTGDDFVLKLESRIAEFEAEKISIPVTENKESLFQKIFGQKRNQWLVPAMGLIVLAVFTFSIVKFNETQTEDKSVLSETKTSIPIDKNSIESNKTNTELKDADKIPDGNVTSKEELDKLKGKMSTTYRESEINKNMPVPVESTSEKITKSKVTSSPPEIKSSVETELSKSENSADINKPESKDKSKDESESALGEETSAMKSGVTTSETNVQQEMKKTSDDETKEFEGAIEQSIIEKLNKVNKQKLDSLKKKINKP